MFGQLNAEVVDLIAPRWTNTLPQLSIGFVLYFYGLFVEFLLTVDFLWRFFFEIEDLWALDSP